MNSRFEIREILLGENAVTKEAFLLQKAAYKIEADLIDFHEIPPLTETLGEMLKSGETFLGCFLDEELAGIAAFKIEEEVLDIHRMAVSPKHFKKGVATALLKALEEIDCQKIIVSTAVKNTPAIQLYLKNNYKKTGERKINDGLTIACFEKNIGTER